MLRRSAICALALTVAAVAALPAQAEPVHTPTLTKTSRFTRLDTAQLGKIVNRPQSQNQDKVVSALVQLSGDPVAVQRDKGVRGFTRRSAERRVKAIQDNAMPKLKAAGATSYGRLDTVLNAVQVKVRVRDLAKVAAVRGVKTVQVSTQVKPMNAAAGKFTGVDRTWQDLRRTGRGQVIGIIDTGVDYTHAGFGGPGTAAAYTGNNRTVIEPGTFPTAKVTGGYDFVGDAYDAGSDMPSQTIPRPDRDPLDCHGHGSHVAGTAAGGGVASNGAPYTGPYNAATLNQTFDVAPGAAPQATIKAYKVFGCEGSVNDDIVVAAIDRAVSDGVDVVNMSLGSAFGTADNLNDVAIRTATDSGTLVVISAGNEGSSAYIVGQSSTSTDALSVAAVDAELKRYPGVSITGAVSASALNANEATIASPITGELVDLGLGCDGPAYAAAAGKIALTTRGGDCARVDRANFGQQAGALAVLMINSEPGLPPFEGTIAGVTIPFIGVDLDLGPALRAADGESITIAASAGIVNTGYGLAADFSSNGPRRVDSAQKPDVGAPGVSIRSVAKGTGTGSTRMSGTSMAAPHTTGVAALVRQARPTWTPRQVKAALMSTANPDKIGNYDSRRVGTGLVQPLRAAAAKTYSYTTSRLNSLRFGMNQLTGAHTETQSFRIANRTKSTSVTYDLATKLSSNGYGADISISPRSVKLKAGETRTISVRITLSRADVARLPGASANEDGRLVSLNGLIVATPRKANVATPALRTSFLFVPVPLSHIRASASVAETSPGVFSAIKVTNKGVHAGTADLYAWLLADPAGDAFDSETADLTNIGVQSLPGEVGGAPASDRLMVFAASQAVWTSTQATREVDIVIDTNGDEEADFVTFAADTGLVLTGTADGTMSSFTQNLATGDLVDVWTAPAPANGSTIELPVLASSLGLTAASGPITVAAFGYTILYAAPGDEVNGTASFNPFQPVVSQGDFVSLNPGQTKSIPVQVDSTQLASQTSAGWLVVNLDDRAGISEADRVVLKVSRPNNAALLNKTTR